MVAGYAIGGGHVLHLMCDLTIAADNAVFGQTGPIVGSFDGGFGASYMARVIGQKRAREIWYLCRKYNAQEALQMGLVNKVVPMDQLDEATMSLANKLAKKSPLALQMGKQAFYHMADMEFGKALEYSNEMFAALCVTEDAKEGVDAFLKKRQPVWKMK